MYVTNKYLKASISEISNFFRNNTQPPEDMYMNLIMELKVSDLIIPIVFDGENISFPHIEVDDGTKLLPLFTSEEELKKYSEDFDYFSNEIAYYIELVKDYGFDGILIDLGSDEFCIDDVLLKKIPLTRQKESKNPFDAEKLRDIALSEKNESLKRFIQNEDRNEANTFTLFTTKSGREHYGTLYTDTDAIVSFHETLKYHYYVQVTNKYTVFNFILANDLDGLIINPGTDDYYVPRQVLLRLLNDDLVNPDLANATRYAFPIK